MNISISYTLAAKIDTISDKMSSSQEPSSAKDLKEPLKIHRCVGVSHADYEHAMAELKAGRTYKFTDRDGNEDEVKLVDGEIIEPSTNRKVVDMEAMMKEKSDAKVMHLSVFGKLMVECELLGRQDYLCFFLHKTNGKRIIYNAQEDRIVAEME